VMNLAYDWELEKHFALKSHRQEGLDTKFQSHERGGQDQNSFPSR
jgi:hypothetical protein